MAQKILWFRLLSAGSSLNVDAELKGDDSH